MHNKSEKLKLIVKSNPVPLTKSSGEHLLLQSGCQKFILQSREVGADPLEFQVGHSATHVVLLR